MSQHDFTADLPPPRDDEPASLRQDIIDELTDHLECATRRELLTNTTASGGRQSPLGDELTAAQSRALTRFGNPAKIARQLWLDAMQEKLMAQRLITGASFVVAITAIVLVVLMWKDMMTHRDLLMEQMAIQRQENAQLLTQLNASYSKLTEFSQLFDQFKLKDQPTKAIPVSASSDIEWLSYKIDVRQGDVDGPPATGLRVYFTPSRSSSQGSDIPPVDLVTDENGHADFGLVRYGVYHLDMWTPAGENYSEEVRVYPGKSVKRTIVSPPELNEPVDVKLRIEWPSGFDHTDVSNVFWRSTFDAFFSGFKWTIENSDLGTSGIVFESDETIRLPATLQVSEVELNNERPLLRFNNDLSKVTSAITLPSKHYAFRNPTFLVALPEEKNSSKTKAWLRVFDFKSNDSPDAWSLEDGSPPTLVLTVPPDAIDAIMSARHVLANATVTVPKSPEVQLQ